MEQQIDTQYEPTGEYQRYDIVSGFGWDDISFVHGVCTPASVEALASLYRTFIIPKDPQTYGILVFCHVPDTVPLPFPSDTVDGMIYDRQALVAYHVTKLIDEHRAVFVDDALRFEDVELDAFFARLAVQGYLTTARGLSDSLSYLPVSAQLDFPSRLAASSPGEDVPETTVVCNAHFFLMEVSDRESPYDVLGTTYGLAVQDGVVLQPPLNHREALFVDMAGKVEIGYPELTNVGVLLDGRLYQHGKGCLFYARPECRVSPACSGTSVAIVNDRVMMVKPGGNAVVPMAGFILQTDEPITISNPSVGYTGLERYRLGLQVGPAMVSDGVMIDTFRCPFYQGEGTPYPPTVFSLPYDSVKAARMSIGERDGNPLLIWAEGASKLGYQPGEESSGRTLPEFAWYCGERRIRNLINLDGGGSAQILYQGERALLISDRQVETNLDTERPVPLCLRIVHHHEKE